MDRAKKIILGFVSGLLVFSPFTMSASAESTVNSGNVYRDAVVSVSVTYDDGIQTKAAVTTSVAVKDPEVTTTTVSGTEDTTKTPSEITVVPDEQTPPVTTTTTNVPDRKDVYNVFDIYDAYTGNGGKDGLSVSGGIYSSEDLKRGIKGIDVSKWQDEIDWTKVKSSGTEFAIIRAGYGNMAVQEDPKFDTNMKNAALAGIPRGVYWYSYATTAEDARREADVCYSVIKGYKFEYPLMFDIEERSQADLSTATVSAIVDAFCSRMQERGYYVTIYSYANFLNTKIYDNILKKYDVAVAHYGVASPNFHLPYGIWQYSSTGSVNGINGNVDLDYAYKDYPALIKSKHMNGY